MALSYLAQAHSLELELERIILSEFLQGGDQCQGIQMITGLFISNYSNEAGVVVKESSVADRKAYVITANRNLPYSEIVTAIIEQVGTPNFMMMSCSSTLCDDPAFISTMDAARELRTHFSLTTPDVYFAICCCNNNGNRLKGALIRYFGHMRYPNVFAPDYTCDLEWLIEKYAFAPFITTGRMPEEVLDTAYFEM